MTTTTQTFKNCESASEVYELASYLRNGGNGCLDGWDEYSIQVEKFRTLDRLNTVDN